MTEQPGATTPPVDDQAAADRAVQGEQTAGTTAADQQGQQATDQGAQEQAQPADQTQAASAGNAADEGGEPAA